MEFSDSDAEAVWVSPPNRWLPALHPVRLTSRVLSSPAVTRSVQAGSTEDSDVGGNRFKPDLEQHRARDAELPLDPDTHGSETGGSWEPHVVPLPLELCRLGPPPEICGPRQAASRAIADLRT